MRERSETQASQWGKAVKKAVIDHDMTLKQLAEKIGYSNATVSQVVNGRYSNSSYKVIAEKINEVLGTEGLPERTETPSDEWCQTVKVELVKQSMTVNELAKQLDVSRDRLSLAGSAHTRSRRPCRQKNGATCGFGSIYRPRPILRVL